MYSVLFDECFQNLNYAQETMNSWIPVSDYEIIFEAVNPEIQDKLFKNDNTGSKSIGFIQKAINKLLEIINKVIEGIREFIARLTMSGEEREAYEKFKSAVARDPKLKNRQVSVLDFRKISAQFDKMVSEVDTNIQAVQKNPDHQIDSVVNKASNFLKDITGASTAIVATDIAIKMADSNIEMAKTISKTLDEEKDIMENLKKQLGKHDAKKFKKEIDAAAKSSKLHSIKVALFRKKYTSLEECVTATLGSFKGLAPKLFASAVNSARRNFEGEDVDNDKRASAVAYAAKKGIGVYLQGNKIIKDKKRQESKRAKEAEKAQKQAEKEAAKQEKFDAKHEGDPRYKSKSDFIFGR
jgi:hypothetical protein